MIMFLQNIMRTKEIKLFLIIWLVYLFFLSPYIMDNENRYLSLIHSIVNHRTFKINAYNKSTCDTALYNNDYFCGAAPGPAFLGVPFYIVFKQIYNLFPKREIDNYDKPDSFGSIGHRINIDDTPESFVKKYPYKEFLFSHFFIAAFTVSFLSALTSILLYRILCYFLIDEKQRLLIVFIYAFGTIVFSYSTRLFAHVIATFFAFRSFYLLFSIKQEGIKNKWLFYAGLSAGTAILMDYYLLIGWIWLFIYLLHVTNKKVNLLPFFLIGSLIPVGVLLIYHYSCFGNPFILPYNYSSVWFNSVYSKGLFGMNWPKGSIIRELLVGFYRGYFYHMPVLLLSIYGIFIGLKMKKNRWHFETLVCLGIFLSFLFFNASRIFDWNSGYPCVGPRYLIPTIPFMVLPLAFVFSKLRFRFVLYFGIFSILLNLINAQYPDLDSLSVRLINAVTVFIKSPVSRFSMSNSPIFLIINGFFIAGVIITSITLIKNEVKQTKSLFWITFCLLFFITVSNFIISFKIMGQKYTINIEDYLRTISNKNPIVEIPISDAIFSRGIRLESVLANSMEVPQGAEIAVLDVFSSDGEKQSFNILAGKDTSEWAWERNSVKLKIKHKKAKISDSWLMADRYLPYLAHNYYTYFEFEKPVSPAKISVSYVYDNNVDTALILKNVYLLLNQR